MYENKEILEYMGYKNTLERWANLVKISPQRLKNRLNQGWTLEDALFCPIGEWRSYINGNCMTSINIYTGTKIHETIDKEENYFNYNFSESFDLNTTNKCDGGCPFCYQGCTTKGEHADLMNKEFLKTVKPYTEVAINGNDLSNPDLIPFLKFMKQKQVIVSITLNQKHFMANLDFVRSLYINKLIHGIGVSLVEPTEEFIATIKHFKTAVVHVIAGLITKEELDKLSNNGLSILILGYKSTKNRGKDYYNNGHQEIIDNRIIWLSQNLPRYLAKFKVVSFDNLALKQLKVNEIISEDMWNRFYMGNDGEHTFYIDAVANKFAKSSMAETQYDILDDIDEMFRFLKDNEL